MSNGVNKVILIGGVGQDPETKFTQSGTAVTNLSVATSETWKDKNTGQKQEKTEWHRVVFFNRLAEIVGEYVRKGSKIYIEGSLQTRKWQDQNGQDRYTTEIKAHEMQMLGSKSDSNQQSQVPQQQAQQGYQQQPPLSKQAQYTPQQNNPQGYPQAAPQAAPQPVAPSFEGDWDVPF